MFLNVIYIDYMQSKKIVLNYIFLWYLNKMCKSTIKKDVLIEIPLTWDSLINDYAWYTKVPILVNLDEIN